MNYSNEQVEAVLANADMTITNDEIYDAVRRGWTDLSDASNEEIVDYFSGYSVDSMVGVVSNTKGIVLEMELERALDDAGMDASLFAATNNPGTDIYLANGQEFSVKSGMSVEPTFDDLSEGLDVIATSEIANQTDAIDAFISSIDLTDVVMAAF